LSFQPTLLEDSLDPWLLIEQDAERRETVVRFLMALCDADGVWDDARPVAGTRLPAFAALVPKAGVVVVWVIAETHSQLAIRYLYDIVTGERFGA
jgi:hypothetical protein